MKKSLAILALLIVLGAGGVFAAGGMSQRTNVVLLDYSASEDGSVLTLQTSIPSSMGYIRDMRTERTGGELRCSFYNTFGGFNSSLGAEDTFTAAVDPDCRAVYFDRGGGRWALVLSRGVDGTWERPDSQNS